MRSFKDFEDILNQLKEKLPESSPDDILRSKVQSDLDTPISKEEILDQLTRNSPKTKNIIKADNVPRKVSSFIPEDLNNPSSTAIPNPAEERGFKLVPKDVYQLRNEPMDLDPAHIRASNAAQRNPLVPTQTATQVGPGQPPSMNPVSEAASEINALPNQQSRLQSLMSQFKKGLNPDMAQSAMNVAGAIPKLAAAAEIGIPLAEQYGPKLMRDAKHLVLGDPEITPPNIPGGVDDSGAEYPAVWAPNQTEQNIKLTEADKWGKIPFIQKEENIPDNAPDAAKANIEAQTSGSESTPLQKFFEAQRSLASDQGTNLKAAQEQANNTRFAANLGRALNQIASGTSGGGLRGVAKVDNSGLDQLTQEAEVPVKQYAEQVADQKNDPSSRYSQIMREFLAPKLAQAGIDVNSEQYRNTPASALEVVGKQAMAEAALKQKQEYLDAVRQAKSVKESEKQAKDLTESDTKRLDSLNKMINGALASSRSGFGKDINNLNAIENAKALLLGEGNLNEIDNRQIAETARVLDRILSQGSPTISGTEHLTPDSARMRAAKMLEFITNKRQGAGAKSFLDNTLHTLDREEAVSKKRVQEAMKKSASSYLDIAERNPEAWDSVMSAHGLKDALGTQSLKLKKEDKGSKKEETKVSTAIDPEVKVRDVSKPISIAEIKEYAKTKNKSEEEVKKFFISKGYKVGK